MHNVLDSPSLPSDEEEDMPQPVSEPQPKRERYLERGRRGFRRGRRGRSVRSVIRSRTSQMRQNLREVDEANGWCYEPRERPLDEPVFEEVSKILAPIDENASEYDCFLVFFTEEFLKTKTNRYAAQMKAQQPRREDLKPGSMLDTWKPVTLERAEVLYEYCHTYVASTQRKF